MAQVSYLSLDQVLSLHQQAISDLPGTPGIRSLHQLSAAVTQPQASAFGEDAYASVPAKAAAYGFFLAEAQAFLDGNKRVAAASMLVFLDINGFDLRRDDDQIAEAFEALGAGTMDQEQFFAWVGAFAQPRP